MVNKQETQSTQQFVDVDHVKNGVVFLKNGSLRKVLLVSGINFELKSEEEQNLIIGAYQNFLNSLDFSLQVVIHSRKLNIDAYLKNLGERQDSEKNDLLKEQIDEYSKFIKSFVEMNAIMAKNFFVVVPYDSGSLIEESSAFLNMFRKNKTNDQLQNQQKIDEQINQLNQRTDHIIAGLSGIGLRAVSLNDEELIELFYNLYNPASVEKKDLTIAKQKSF